MASTRPAIDNGAVAAEPVVPTSTAAEQSVVAEAAETNGEEAEAASTEAPAATETTEADEKEKELAEVKAKWPGWPGYSVFRIVVPVLKVGGIIGRKGDLIKKLVEETRARVRVLDGPITSPDRIVLVSGKEEPGAALSPAMDAIIRIFKRVNGLPENDGDGKTAGAAFCSIRLLVASTQAISLIGKQGSLIKSIQENTGASVRVLSNDDMPVYASSDERIVELQGEGLKVLKALEAVVGHLRKFLVDHSVLPLFEKSYNAPTTQERQVDTWTDKTLLHATPQTSRGADYPVSIKRDSLFLDRESQIESHIASSRHSLYVPDHSLGSRSSTIGRSGGPVVTQMSQTMQIPLAYAEDIIGVQGANIDYIRRTSGAILTVQESRGLPDEITVEIKGTSSQVQAAQQLIQEFTSSGHREPLPGSYGKLESSLRPSYSQLGSSSYSSSSFSGQPYGGYSSSGIGGYSSFRL
ncbi:RNA-binding KH domain-containing protein PEPPER [Sesamum indicum]|uniref:RNA-binding KH domain-containing protein PEPPER n=1 Tax=Sesamum indicum TaxID=4182 RepID=A0A6I9U8Q1_SESIN|nr:RNA-binding KH domain-containing protein PEPPER [Sesamum indicum]